MRSATDSRTAPKIGTGRVQELLPEVTPFAIRASAESPRVLVSLKLFKERHIGSDRAGQGRTPKLMEQRVWSRFARLGESGAHHVPRKHRHGLLRKELKRVVVGWWIGEVQSESLVPPRGGVLRGLKSGRGCWQTSQPLPVTDQRRRSWMRCMSRTGSSSRTIRVQRPHRHRPASDHHCGTKRFDYFRPRAAQRAGRTQKVTGGQNLLERKAGLGCQA